MNKAIALIFFCGVAFSACEDAGGLERRPEDAFLKLYGGEGIQEGVDLLIGPDNAYYLLGNSLNRNNWQIYLVKTDEAGNVIWEKTFGGPNEEIAKDIELTSSGLLAIVADTRTNAGDKDILVLTVNQDGRRVDSTVYAHSAKDEEAASITPITSGYLVAGSTLATEKDPTDNAGQINVKDGIILRLNPNLSVYTGIWGEAGRAYQRGPGTVFAIQKVMQENADRYTVFAYNNARDLSTSGLNNAYIYTINNSAGEGAEFVFGRPEDDERVTSVTRDKITSGYAVTGISTKPNGRQNVFCVFVGIGGGSVAGGSFTLITTDLSQAQNEFPMSAAVTGFRSGLFLVGATKNYWNQSAEQGDIFLKLVDRLGTDLWSNPESVTFGGVANDFIGGVAETADQRALIVGTMGLGDVQGQRKMVLIKVNREGKFAP